jgi:hypothetical protein
LSHVGFATSVGFMIEIPIIIRSLAQSFGGLRRRDFPLTFDLEFLRILELDRSASAPIKYHLPWWTGPNLPVSQISQSDYN